MGTLQQIPTDSSGTADLREMARMLLEAMVSAVTDAQADAPCEGGANARSGYRERGLATPVGDITMRIPKLRAGAYLPEGTIGRYSRVGRAVAAAVAEMHTNGVSTREVRRAAEEVGMERLSAERVSSTCPSLGEGVAALEPRRLGGLEFPCLFLDATYVKCRRGRRARSTAVATATACGSDGARRVVGFGATDAEAYPGWPGFCRDLRRRGLSGVRCAAGDAHEGLRRAIGERLPGAAWQRCTVHLERNVCSPPKTKRRGAVAGEVPKAVFREGDPAVVREACHAAVDAMSRMSRAASELLEGAGSDALAYPDLPRERRRRIRTSNVQERANGEMKRRSRVVQVLPSTPPMARLIGAVMAGEDEDWPSRRWIVPESLARPDEPRAPEPVATEAAKGRAIRIVRSATELSGPSKEAA